MNARLSTIDPPYRQMEEDPPRRALVLDDSRGQRVLLASMLKRWGWDVVTEENPFEALDQLSGPGIDLVLCDWVMPLMSGPEFCQRLRRMDRADYPYVILLTGKSEKSEIAHALDAGADDFLTKPVTGPELRARINAGERLIAMQRKLVVQNHLVRHALDELQDLYDHIDRDLAEARKLQKSLVGETCRRFGPSTAALALHSSGHIGGDLVGVLPLPGDRLAVYGIDVSGHGITSALMTAQIGSMFSARRPEQSIISVRDHAGRPIQLTPHEVVERLNTLLRDGDETELYLTVALAEIDFKTGRLDLAQAGHPHPILIRKDRRIEILGEGGLPVGLIDDAEWQALSTTMEVGDRLLIYSDGVTEAMNPKGDLLEEDGLIALLHANIHLSGEGFLGGIHEGLMRHREVDGLEDDVSMVLLEYGGPPVAAT